MHPLPVKGLPQPGSFVTWPYRVSLPLKAGFDLSIPDEAEGQSTWAVQLTPVAYADTAATPERIMITVSTDDRFVKSARVLVRAIFPQAAGRPAEELISNVDLNLAEGTADASFSLPDGGC